MKWLILLIPLIFLTGCIQNEIRDYYKDGVVIQVRYDVIFGGTFTDYRDELYFDDGEILWIQDSDLSKVRLNEFGEYHFKTNFFTYDGVDYEFYKLVDVRYFDMEI